MRRFALLASALCLLAADKPQGGAKALDGTWALVRGEQDGVALPASVVRVSKLTIEGERHTVKLGEDELIGKHTVDAAKGTIDTTDTEGPLAGRTLKGIYRLKGDELTVCFAAPGDERPTELSTEKGTGHLLHVWKRQKK
jgi:uncharacterized protein (TIGR03067 family)